MATMLLFWTKQLLECTSTNGVAHTAPPPRFWRTLRLPHNRATHVTLTQNGNIFELQAATMRISNYFPLQLRRRSFLNIARCKLLQNTQLTSKMPRALILVADRSEEIELVTPYDGKYLLPCDGMLHQQSSPK
jgi:hypothetical protein